MGCRRSRFCGAEHLDYANRKAHVKEIAEWFRGSGVPFELRTLAAYADYDGGAGAPRSTWLPRIARRGAGDG